MNHVLTGKIDYHDRKGSRVLSWLILAATVVITLLVRLLTGNSIIAIISFIAALIILAIATMPLETKLYVHEASYELTSQKLVLHLAKQDLVLYRNELYGVGCDPVATRGGSSSEDVNYWKITIQTLPKGTQKKKKYEIFSLNSNNSNEKNQQSLQEFQDFGKELKHWFVTTG